jgi:hypothetical protein
MVGLGAITNLRGLSLDEIADVNVTAQMGSRPQMGKWSNNSASIDAAPG